MRILGLDYGSKTVGVAISDELGITAQGIETIIRTKENQLRKTLTRIESICVEYGVTDIVLGLPKNMDGSLGFQAQDCMNFAQKIVGFDIIMEDERLTSEEAENRLRSRKVDFRKNKGAVDIESACVILEQYLGK